MSFSFNPSIATDLDLVRFHIGDVHEEGHYLDDETITYLVTTHGVAGAVVRAIDFIITQLSQPNFRLDWLTVTNSEARAGFEKLKKDKEQELGVSTGAIASASVSLPSRADSYMTTSDQDGAP